MLYCRTVPVTVLLKLNEILLVPKCDFKAVKEAELTHICADGYSG